MTTCQNVEFNVCERGVTKVVKLNSFAKPDPNEEESHIKRYMIKHIYTLGSVILYSEL